MRYLEYVCGMDTRFDFIRDGRRQTGVLNGHASEWIGRLPGVTDGRRLALAVRVGTRLSSVYDSSIKRLRFLYPPTFLFTTSDISPIITCP